MFNRFAGLLAGFFAVGIAAPQAEAAAALAIDSNQGAAWGYGTGFDYQSDADARALSECGGNCTVVLQFSNTCGAYAADQSPNSTVFGWGTAADGSSAQARAMGECRASGGYDCIVRVWACDE